MLEHKLPGQRKVLHSYYTPFPSTRQNREPQEHVVGSWGSVIQVSFLPSRISRVHSARCFHPRGTAAPSAANRSAWPCRTDWGELQHSQGTVTCSARQSTFSDAVNHAGRMSTLPLSIIQRQCIACRCTACSPYSSINGLPISSSTSTQKCDAKAKFRCRFARRSVSG